MSPSPSSESPRDGRHSKRDVIIEGETLYKILGIDSVPEPEAAKVTSALRQVYNRLEARFADQVRGCLPKIQQDLADSWDSIKAGFNSNDLFCSRVILKSQSDKNTLEILVDFSKTIIIMDPILMEAVDMVMRAEGYRRVLPQMPEEWKVCLSMHAACKNRPQGSGSAGVAMGALTRSEIQAISEFLRGPSGGVSGKEALRRAETPVSGREQLGNTEFIWRWFKGNKRYRAGWEPAYPGRYKNSTILSLSRRYRERVLSLKQQDLKDPAITSAEKKASLREEISILQQAQRVAGKFKERREFLAGLREKYLPPSPPKVAIQKSGKKSPDQRGKVKAP